MSFGGWRIVSSNVDGDSVEFGCNDIKLINQLFNGLDVPAVKIGSANGFYFKDSALRFRNPLDTQTLTIRTPAITAARALAIPLLLADDIMAVTATSQTFSNKVLDATCNVTAAVGSGAAAHATTHESGGSDPIPLDLLAAPSDITTLNASITAHGLLRKLDNNATHFLNGVGNWAVPAGGAGGGTPDITGVVYVASDGSGDYTTFQSALTTEGASKKYVLAPGDHNVTAQLISSLSNIWIEGSGVGVTRLVYTSAATTGAAFIFQGALGSSKTVTANATRGSHTITVNNTTGIAAGDWIYLFRDVVVQTAGNGGKDAEVHQVYSVTSTVITLVDQTMEDYLTTNGALVYRITLVKNLKISNLTMYDNRDPATVTNITEQSDTLFLFCYNLQLDHVMFEHMLYAACTFQNCINSTADSCYVETPKMIARPIPNPYWVNYGFVFLSACLNVSINGGWANRCRHSVTTDIVGGTYGAGKQRGITVNGMTSYNANTSHFDSHEGAPGIIFNGCVAMGGYHQIVADYVTGGSPTQQTDNVKSFTARSASIFNGCVAMYPQGFSFAVFNDNTDSAASDTIPGGNTTQIINCRIEGSQPDQNSTQKGIRIYGRQGVIIKGCEFINIPETCILFSESSSTNKHTIIDGCTFFSCGANINSSTGIIQCDANMDDFTIKNCMFGAGTAPANARPVVFGVAVDRFEFAGNNVQALTNKTLTIPTASTDVNMHDNPGLNPIGKITNPVGSGTIGSYGGTGAAVSASTDYTIVGGRMLITATGGTGVSITIKDKSGATVQGSISTPLYITLVQGMKINFGGFSVAPTVVCSAE